MDKPSLQCRYHGLAGLCKDTPLPGEDYCFWHHLGVDKSGADVCARLESRAKTGEPMEGFVLKKANLENINLVNKSGEPFRLINVDLSRANLKNAHLFKVDLSGSCLLKANLSNSNLHCANLSDCNLLGVNFKGCRLEKVIWGETVLQASMARGHRENTEGCSNIELYEEAEEVARNIRKSCEAQGLFDIAGSFFHKEMVFRRHQLPRRSLSRGLSKGVDLVSGYGEKPGRIVLFSTAFIFLCSLFYFFSGLSSSGQPVGFDGSKPVTENITAWLDCLYFSVVTFTTLGYGDLTPLGPSRLFAALEAFTGSFSLALFVVVFVKKMTR